MHAEDIAMCDSEIIIIIYYIIIIANIIIIAIAYETEIQYYF